jgi:hypothetical protein
MEGKIWDDWNKVMRQEVPAHQIKVGSEAGSWSPQGDKWAGISFGAGRLYMTCLSIYMLEVYYRHLPIYSGYKAFDAVVPAPVAAAKEVSDARDKPADDQVADEKASPQADAKAPPAADAIRP